MPLDTFELKARDVMTPDPICVQPSATIRELARLFEDHDISGAPVVDQEGTVVGIVSKSDLIRQCSLGTGDIPPAYLFDVLSEQGSDEDQGDIPPESPVYVEDFMTESPWMVSPEHSAAAIARLMVDRRIHRVIVVDDEGCPIGIVTSLDLLGACPPERGFHGCITQPHQAPIPVTRSMP